MSVEFLPGSDPDQRPERPPRRIWPGWWLVALLLVAGVVGWALTRSPSTPDAATPSTAPTTAAPSTAGSPAVDRPVFVPSVQRRPTCQGILDCAVRDDVPHPVAHLAGADLPAGAHLQVRTLVRLSSATRAGAIIERDVDAQVDSVRVLIRIQHGGDARRAIVVDPPGVGSLLLHAPNSGFLVRLQYLAPDGVAPIVTRLRALMRDPRLLSM